MISQLFILSSKGDRLVYRNFRGDGRDDVTDAFYRAVTALPGDQAPVFMAHEGQHFVHVRHGGLYVAATTAPDASPFVLVEFLNRLVTLLREHCGTLSEKSVTVNISPSSHFPQFPPFRSPFPYCACAARRDAAARGERSAQWRRGLVG
ncbi:AP-4 complex subunit mu-1-like [Numida meleagris]|uniref:AP-4 complex subunit mu-1-like n=1 Tax=Numida meleagris TaxID=8996 RepID=UPI000B3E18B0|nr:AP-4 complex subunit mu-1-like [Numida meleagris]